MKRILDLVGRGVKVELLATERGPLVFRLLQLGKLKDGLIINAREKKMPGQYRSYPMSVQVSGAAVSLTNVTSRLQQSILPKSRVPPSFKAKSRVPPPPMKSKVPGAVGGLLKRQPEPSTAPSLTPSKLIKLGCEIADTSLSQQSDVRLKTLIYSDNDNNLKWENEGKLWA